jgi:hypothetical protein
MQTYKGDTEMNHFDILELEEDAQKVFKDILKLKAKFYRMTKKPRTGDIYDTSELNDLQEDLDSVVIDWEENVLDRLETCRKENWRARNEHI